MGRVERQHASPTTDLPPQPAVSATAETLTLDTSPSVAAVQSSLQAGERAARFPRRGRTTHSMSNSNPHLDANDSHFAKYVSQSETSIDADCNADTDSDDSDGDNSHYSPSSPDSFHGMAE